MAFEEIKTEEQFNTIIQDRLRRDREARQKEIKEKYGDLDALKAENDRLKTLESENTSLKSQAEELKKAAEADKTKYAGLETQLTELQGKVKGYEADALKARVAQEKGLPYGLAGRLRGETEEELRKDADSLRGYFSTGSPMGSTEPAGGGDANAAAMKQLLQSLKGE